PEDEDCLDDLEMVHDDLLVDEITITPAVEGAETNWFKAVLGGLLIGVALIGSGGLAAGLGTPLFGGALFGVNAGQALIFGAGLLLSAFFQPPEANYDERET